MGESHAAVERDFSKPLREATRFVAFRSGGISTAGLLFLRALRFLLPGYGLRLFAAVVDSGAPVLS